MNEMGQMNGARVVTFPLPAELAAALRKFLLDRRKGNISLNVRDGKILGFHVEEIVTISK